jgi:hypothetical protein
LDIKKYVASVNEVESAVTDLYCARTSEDIIKEIFQGIEKTASYPKVTL